MPRKSKAKGKPKSKRRPGMPMPGMPPAGMPMKRGPMMDESEMMGPQRRKRKGPMRKGGGPMKRRKGK